MVVIHFQFHVKLESLKMKSVEIKSTAAQPPSSALFCTVWPRFATAALLPCWCCGLKGKKYSRIFPKNLCPLSRNGGKCWLVAIYLRHIFLHTGYTTDYLFCITVSPWALRRSADGHYVSKWSFADISRENIWLKVSISYNHDNR